MTDWLTIRVVLVGQHDEALALPPGRVMLVHADHSLAELGEAIDTAFGRWDLTPLHQFEVEGRLLLGPDEVPEDDEVEDTEEVTVGELGLRPGTRFTYVFDLGEGWTHECLVEDMDVDPLEIAGEEPEVPIPFYGWGSIPDQYGRAIDDDTEDEVDGEDEERDWQAVEEESWRVVESALAEIPRPLDEDALRTAAATLRRRIQAEDGGPYEVLAAAADLDPDDLPDDDRELWLTLAAGVVAPAEDIPLDPDSVAAWASLEPADWAGAVIELVRGGVGTHAAADTLAEMIARCPEVESAELSGEAQAVLVEGLTIVVRLWRTLGAIGPDEDLTLLGLWGLPESLRLAWTDEA